MDFVFGIAEYIGNWIAAAIEHVTGWRPDERAKNIIHWVGVITSTIAGIWTLGRLIRGGGTATKQDVDMILNQLQALREAREASQGPPGGTSLSVPDTGMARDLSAAVETVAQAGNRRALKDKTGAAVEEAIDALLAEHAAARKRQSKEEAALWRQKGALAFLRDTKAALAAYAKATELDPDDVEAWNALGHLQQRVGKSGEAIASFERVRGLADKSGNLPIAAMAIGNIGISQIARSEISAAERSLTEALRIYEKLGKKVGMANQLGNLGSVHAARGDFEKALAAFRQALAIDEALGRKDGMANAYANIGNVFLRCEQPDKAEAMYRKALALYEQLGSATDIATSTGNLGNVHLTRDEIDAAEAMFRKALEIDTKLGHKQGIANHYGNLGIVFDIRDDLEQAEAMYRKGLAINVELGDKVGMANAYGNLGILSERRGNLAEACDYWRKALDLSRQIGAKPMIEKMQGWLRNAGDPAGQPGAVL